MGIVFLEMTMTLDGFVAAPNISREHPLGENGKRIHDWMFRGASQNDIDRQVANEFFDGTGAFIIGKSTFELGIGEWGKDGAFGMPCFVLTSHPQERLIKGPTTFTFVTDGVHRSFEQAKTAAGDKNICVMGGANVAQQYLKAGLIDEIRLHIAPILFINGTRLFNQEVKLEKTRHIESPFATHLRFKVIKE